MIKVKDIYAGKPDAKDEVETEGLAPLIENYVMPENFNISSLINGTGYYITGYKGTGKTALLYYLDAYIKEKDISTCSSFIFFKGDYSDLKKQEMELLSKRLTSAISIGNDVVLAGTDFEYIWRWLFYRRFIEDNEAYNYGIFRQDENWLAFEKTISQIGCGTKKRFLSIPAKVSLACPISDITHTTKMEPKMELDFSATNMQDLGTYKFFTEIIDEADDLFTKLKRTDIPYYVFIDELEAYYGDEDIFKRDLRLIRDLIFTVKKLNQVLGTDKQVKTKLICSVRTEIVNAINRFIVSKELNKVISGFEVPLIWDYTNTNSFNHPIMKILLKRIEYAEKQFKQYEGERRLIEKWFPEKINGSGAANYLLNNSWCKPRDIVRLILSAQNCIGCENSSFSQSTIDLSHKRYSLESLIEIKEEMKALYSASEINAIITCLTGFKRVFSLDELQERIEKTHKGTIWDNRTTEILTDLYRLGIVGNYMHESESYRWQHKGDDGIILDDVWKIMIHAALQNALSVNRKQDRVVDRKTQIINSNIPIGQFVEAKVEKICPTYIIVTFGYAGREHVGSIHISQIAEMYIKDINDHVKEGSTHQAKVIRYNAEHKKWELTLKK